MTPRNSKNLGLPLWGVAIFALGLLITYGNSLAERAPADKTLGYLFLLSGATVGVIGVNGYNRRK